MNIPGLTNVSADRTVPIEKLAGNGRLTEEEKVAESARQFEAVLLRQILSAARKTVIKSGLDSESSVNDVYQDMINNQLADAISQSGTFGLARSLQVQLSRQTLGHPSSPGATPNASSAPVASASSPALRVNHD